MGLRRASRERLINGRLNRNSPTNQLNAGTGLVEVGLTAVAAICNKEAQLWIPTFACVHCLSLPTSVSSLSLSWQTRQEFVFDDSFRVWDTHSLTDGKSSTDSWWKMKHPQSTSLRC